MEIESQACVSHLSDALSTDVRSAAGRLLVGLSGDLKCLSDGSIIMTATKKKLASNSSLIRFSCDSVFESGCVLQLEKTKEEKNEDWVCYLPSNYLAWCEKLQLEHKVQFCGTLAQAVGELTALFTEKRAVDCGSHDCRGELLELEDPR